MTEAVEQSSFDSESEKKLDSERTLDPTNEKQDNEQEFEAIRTTQRQQTPRGLAPLKEVRSRSSARSHKSYDGYTVDRDDDEAEKGDPSDPSRKFEVSFDGETDPFNPRNKPIWRKWLVVLIVASSSLCVTCASSIYTSTYRQIEVEFGISRLVATLGLVTYVCGLGLGPMFLSPLSEFYGRRNIYICAFGMFVIWIIPCAVAHNIETMLVVRFLDGLSGSAFLSVAGGTVGDLFAKEHLSLPMMVYTASPFLGPELGPVFGGFINQYTNWRWSFYLLIIWSAVQWILIVLFVPETYPPVLLRRKAVRLRKESGDDRWKAPIEIMERSVSRTVLWSCIRPFQLLFFEQMCLNLCLLSAVLLGILYLFFGAFAVVFQNNHGFNEWQIGLSFLGILVGMLLGVSCDPLWRRNYNRLVDKNDGISEPEFRLPPTIMGAVIVPISLFGFGWTTYSRIHWIVPIVWSAVFGVGNIFVFSGVFTFLVEAVGFPIVASGRDEDVDVVDVIALTRLLKYPQYAASALAANSFARSSFAAAFPLFGVQMYNKLGYQWASSVLGFIALALSPFPYIFFRMGKRIRSKSRFAQAK